MSQNKKGGPGFPNMKDNAEDFLGAIFVVKFCFVKGVVPLRWETNYKQELCPRGLLPWVPRQTKGGQD